MALMRRGKGKGRGGAPDSAVAQYVNDRPYAASSLLAVALSTVFKSALRSVCAALPARAEAQPGIKVRGREYLRIIYGPEYTRPENLERLRNRFLNHKRLAGAARVRTGARSPGPAGRR